MGILSIILLIGFFLFHVFDFSSFSTSSHPSFLSRILEESASQNLNLESLPGSASLVLGRKINQNQASPKDLEALPEVGPKLAEKIVQNRQKEGKFHKIEDLMRVKGVKDKKFEKIKPFVEIK